MTTTAMPEVRGADAAGDRRYRRERTGPPASPDRVWARPKMTITREFMLAAGWGLSIEALGWLAMSHPDNSILSFVGFIPSIPTLFFAMLLGGAAGKTGPLVWIAAGLLFWTLIVYLVLCVVQPLAKAIKSRRR